MTDIERHGDEGRMSGDAQRDAGRDDPRFPTEAGRGEEMSPRTESGEAPAGRGTDAEIEELRRAAHERETSHPEFMGKTVLDRDGELIGTVDGVYVDEDDTPRYLAVDTGWFGDERHVIPLDGMRRGPEESLVTPASRQTIADGPRGVGTNGLTVDDLAWVHEHYGLESIDMLLAARQTTPAPTPEIAKAEIASAIRSGRDPAEVVVRRWGI